MERAGQHLARSHNFSIFYMECQLFRRRTIKKSGKAGRKEKYLNERAKKRRFTILGEFTMALHGRGGKLYIRQVYSKRDLMKATKLKNEMK